MTAAVRVRPVATEVRDGVACVTLDRPEVINALNLEMVQVVTECLLRWIHDDRVTCVVLRGRGRGLCAGGDLEAEGDSDAFLRAEYALDALIAEYPKPVVALMHGIVLGGGVGLSGHAAVRVVTDSTRIGMPETRIGLCPDVGGCRLLGRMPGGVGLMKALASATMSASEAIAFGLADVLAADDDLDALVAVLRSARGVDPRAVLVRSGLVRSGDPVSRPAWVDDAFSQAETETGAEAPAGAEAEADTETDPGPDALRIVRRLESGPPDARETAARIREMAPLAVAVTVPLVRQAARSTLRETLQREYAVMSVMAARPDTAEGIRARLVDRDTPRWHPGRLEDVRAADVAAVLVAARPPLDFHAIPVSKETPS